MPPSQRFMELTEKMKDIHIRKNAGYAGDNPDAFANFRESEDFDVSAFKGCMVRMSDKWSRIKCLSRNPNNDQVGESIMDTLLDLANYSVIAICLYEEEQKKAEENNAGGNTDKKEGKVIGRYTDESGEVIVYP